MGARAAGHLIAVMMEAVGRVEHARARGGARHAPLRALPFHGLGALLVGARGRVVHARVRRRARATEVEAGARTAREAREVGGGARMEHAGRRRAADVGDRHRRGRRPSRSRRHFPPRRVGWSAPARGALHIGGVAARGEEEDGKQTTHRANIARPVRPRPPPGFRGSVASCAPPISLPCSLPVAVTPRCR